MSEPIGNFWTVLISVIVYLTLVLIIVINISSTARGIFTSLVKNNALVKISSVYKVISGTLYKLRFNEPAEYMVLLIRKPYNDEFGKWLLYSTLSIVAFYFILTVF